MDFSELSKLVSTLSLSEGQEAKWEDIISSLSNKTDPEGRKSAVLKLQNIIQQLNVQKVTLQKETQNQILSTIHSGIKDEDHEDIQALLYQTLHMSFPLITELFQENNARQVFMEIVLKGMTSTDSVVQKAGLQSILEFVNTNYDYLSQVGPPLFEMMLKLILNNQKELKILILQIWDSVAKEEIKRNQNKLKNPEEITLNITAILAPQLIILAFQNLLNTEGDEDIFSASKEYLSSAAKIVGADFLASLVGSYLLSEKESELRAGLAGFSCMMDSPNRQHLLQSGAMAIPTLAKGLTHKSLLIQEAAAEALEKTGQVAPEAYLRNSNIFTILNDLTASLKSDPKVVERIARLWQHLADAIDRDPKQLTENVNWASIIDILLDNALTVVKSEEYHLIDYNILAVSAILRLLGKIDPSTAERYIHRFVSELKKCKEIKEERRELIESGISSCIQTTLLRLNFESDDPIIKEIFDISIDIFNSGNKANALYMIGGLASASGPGFEMYSEKAWSCVTALPESSNEPETFLAVLNTIVELARACPEGAEKYLEDIFENLLKIYKHGVSNPKLKPLIITALGDIALGCKEKIFPYADKIYEIYEMAIDSVSQLTVDETPSEVENIEYLRSAILEAYTCFFHALADSYPDKLTDSLPKIAEFLSLTCAHQYDPTEEYLRNALSLFTDMAMILRERALQYLKKDAIVFIKGTLEKSKDSPENKMALEYADHVFRSINYNLQ